MTNSQSETLLREALEACRSNASYALNAAELRWQSHVQTAAKTIIEICDEALQSIPEPLSDEALVNGLYAAEVYFGWKLLEFHDGEWWHQSAVGRWTACEPVQWVGPLPERKGPKPSPSPQEFDL